MSTQKQHILVMRFSALGDIAMTIPVIRNLLKQHAALEITFVSTAFVSPLFDDIDRLHFYPVDIKEKYKGIAGLYRLAGKLKADIAFDAIADLHDVLRTKIIRFFLAAYPSAAIDKGRAEKATLTRPVNKSLRPLKTTFERYADVFRKLGYDLTLDVDAGIAHPSADKTLRSSAEQNKWLIGMAPFAKHAAKMYPLEKMKAVAGMLGAHSDLQVLIFTSPQEKDGIESWKEAFPAIEFIGGSFTFRQELNLISQLNAMLSMDSANMHLASLSGVPVVSVWGGTHPFLGFYGWGQSWDNIIQEDLSCRPSSVFGNKECPVHGAGGCMQDITPEMLYERILQVIRLQGYNVTA